MPSQPVILALGPRGLPSHLHSDFMHTALSSFIPDLAGKYAFMHLSPAATALGSRGLVASLAFDHRPDGESAFAALRNKSVFTAMDDGAPVQLRLFYASGSAPGAVNITLAEFRADGTDLDLKAELKQDTSVAVDGKSSIGGFEDSEEDCCGGSDESGDDKVSPESSSTSWRGSFVASSTHGRSDVGVGTPPVPWTFQIPVAGRARPLTLRLLQGQNITRWAGDVIVNSANEAMLGGSGVDGAIHHAAGGGLLAACRAVKPVRYGVRCPTGEARLTRGPFPGSRLSAANVIHAVGPTRSTPERAALLGSTYTSCLTLAAGSGFASIAFPSISTGIFNYPKREAASVAARVIVDTALVGLTGDLERLDVCLFDNDSVVLWSDAVGAALRGEPVQLDGTPATDGGAWGRAQPAPADHIKSTSSSGAGGGPKATTPTRPPLPPVGTVLTRVRAAVPALTPPPPVGIVLARVRAAIPTPTAAVEADSAGSATAIVEAVYQLQVLVGYTDSHVEPLLTTQRDAEGAAGIAPHARAVDLLDDSTAGLLDAASLAALRAALTDVSPIRATFGGSPDQPEPLVFVVDIDTVAALHESADDLPAAFRQWRTSTGGRAQMRYRALAWSTVPVQVPPPPHSRPGALPRALAPMAVHVMLTPACHGLAGALRSVHEVGEVRARWCLRARVPTLRKELATAKSAAEAELPAAEANKDALAVETELVPEPTDDMLPKDLVPLSVEDPDYRKVQELLPPDRPPIRIRRVDVPERVELCAQYSARLPLPHQGKVQTFHGTPRVEAASSIARTGPNLSLAGTNIGKVYGAGFYTDRTSAYPCGVAGSGSVLVLEVAPGRTTPHGNSSTTAADLHASGFDSVAPNNWHILFHPDAVHVKFIADFSLGTDTDGGRAAALRAVYDAAVAKRQVKEMVRLAQLQKAQARVDMIRQYVERCNRLNHDLNDANVEVRARLAFLEAHQFKQGLPMYARKNDIVEMIKTSPCCIIIGGTGTGKTVSVPQWTYDEVFFAAGKPSARVAVLVPRRAIAEGLAGYISKMRKGRVGDEVGLGVSGNVKFGEASRLIFMTYGFMAAISRSDDNFSRWDAILLDEAHERNPDADLLLPRMVKAAKARPDSFRAIIMSATIDKAFFGEMIAKNLAPPGTHSDALPNVPSIHVEGVTFPVEDVWADSDWDPMADGAITNLVSFVLKAYRTEKSGNVLVFLPTIRAIDEGTYMGSGHARTVKLALGSLCLRCALCVPVVPLVCWMKHAGRPPLVSTTSRLSMLPNACTAQ
jgi:O-acetyl-ADP-ribose deacetylase (regulator of RNase III)